MRFRNTPLSRPSRLSLALCGGLAASVIVGWLVQDVAVALCFTAALLVGAAVALWAVYVHDAAH